MTGKHIALIIIVVLLVAVTAFVFSSSLASSNEHSVYATGQSYTATGHVIEAVQDGEGRNAKYSVKINMDNELPKGGRIFVSSDKRDFDVVAPCDEKDKTYKFTISPEGYISNAVLTVPISSVNTNAPLISNKN